MRSVTTQLTWALATVSALCFAWPLQASVEHKKNLFMIDHACERRDHQQLVDDRHHCVASKDLDALVDLVIAYFSNQPKESASTAALAKQKMVIFDIDETVLVRTNQDHTTLWSHCDFVALPPIMRLYKHLLAQGYKIAFVTWRKELPGSRDKTLYHLNTNGFQAFEALYLRPKDWKKSCAEWKEHARGLLAKDFDIVATLDDKLSNLGGLHTGACLVWVCERAHRPVMQRCVRFPKNVTTRGKRLC